MAAMCVVGALVAFAHLVFQVNIGVLVVDLFPMRNVATVFGLIAAGSAFGGFASTYVVGQLASTGAYGGIFLLMGMLHPTAWLVAWFSTRGKQ